MTKFSVAPSALNQEKPELKMEADVLYYHEKGKVRYVPQSKRAVEFFAEALIHDEESDMVLTYPFPVTHETILAGKGQISKQSFTFKEISKP